MRPVRGRPVTRVEGLSQLAREVPCARFEREARRGAAACTVAPSAVVPFRNYSRMDAPAFENRSRQRFLAPLQYEAAPVRLYALSDVRFFGSPGMFAVGEALVAESAAHWRLRTDGTLEEIASGLERLTGRAAPPLGPPARRLKGTYVLAASLYSRNYWHWTFELLAGAALLSQAMDLRGVKALVHRRSPVAEASLAALGFAPEDIVVLPRDEAVVVDRLLFSSCFLSEVPRIHPRAPQALQSVKRSVLSGSTAPAAQRRVLASRGASQARLLLDRGELEAAFAAAGFEVVDPGTLAFADQVRLFDEADVVVAEHGANLTNMVYCRPGTLVLELFHPTEIGWASLSFLALAEAMGLPHRSFVGQDAGDGRWTVEVPQVLTFVADALERRRAHQARLQAIGEGWPALMPGS